MARARSITWILLMLPMVAWSADSDSDAAEYRQCQQAMRKENLEFVLRYCPSEAWALARAQCERQPETVSERYKAFCDRFYHGDAPTLGVQPKQRPND